MYELRNGSARLATTLQNVQGDDYTISRLASCLHYIPQQLKEDIAALNDYVSMNLQKDREQEESH